MAERGPSLLPTPPTVESETAHSYILVPHLYMWELMSKDINPANSTVQLKGPQLQPPTALSVLELTGKYAPRKVNRLALVMLCSVSGRVG